MTELGKTPLDLLRQVVEFDIVDRVDVPSREARHSQAPDELGSSAMLRWIEAMTGRADLRRHQSLALRAVLDGRDVVVATGTASGKSLVFQAASILEIMEGNGVTLALYPLKALAADQVLHWQRALQAAELPSSLVAEITGETSMYERQQIIETARIIACTPDVIHAWLMRQVASPAVRSLLARLRYIILDEAHVLEGEFGSNCAYFLRRLQSAQHHAVAGALKKPLQFIAATGTIAEPAEHLRRLTGREFDVIGEPENGAPAAERTLIHIDGPAHGAPAEQMLANLLGGLAERIGDGAFIAFHDSRQGVERITRQIRRDDVLPYRSGYEAADRRAIEAKLRAGALRGVVATSSLELGIDIPQFTIGFTIGVPISRKAFQQRAGRVGRTQVGLFAVIAPPTAFAQIGSSLQEFQFGGAEPSALYLSNPSIQFAQARCLLEECAVACPGEAEELPPGTNWPAQFDRMLELAKPGAQRPRELDLIAALGADSPHLNYPLRHVCETEYALKDVRGSSDPFGSIGLHQAIREAYPGATYYHLRKTCKVRDWRSNSFDRSIRLEQVRSAEPTKPLLRKQVNLSFEAQDIIEGRRLSGERGCLAELQVQVCESVEGFRTTRQTFLYSDLRHSDPRMKRKQREFASTGVVLQIGEPWFSGTGKTAIQNRRLVARALKELLLREHSIQPKDLDYAESCVAVLTAAGPRRIDDAVCIYDTIFGGLRLSAPLFDDLPEYVARLTRAALAAGNEALISTDVAGKLADWFAHLAPFTELSETAPIPLAPGEHLIFAPGSELGLSVQGEVVQRQLIEPQLLMIDGVDRVMYRYAAESGTQAWVPHDQLRPGGQNWRYAVWTPSSGKIRDLELAA